MSRRNFYLVLAAALLFRLVLAIKLDFWYDENFSLALARLPFERMLEATSGDVHPPLYYTVLWCWAQLGGSHPAWLMRIPSLLFSLGSIVMIDRITSRSEFPKRVNVAAVLVMAFIPFQLYYAAEARMYALLGFLFLAGTEAVLAKQWARLWIIVAALAYTHNWGLLYSAALFALALLTNPPRDWLIVSAPFAAAAILWLPWALTLYWQMGSINQSYWLTRVSLGLVLLQIHQLVFGMVLYNPLATILVFCLLMLGIYFIVRDNPRAAALTLVMFSIPFGLGLAISLTWQPILLFRAMAGMAPFLYILLVWPVTRLTIQRASFSAVFIVPLMIAAYVGLFDRSYRSDGTDVLTYIESHWQPGDLIVSTGDSQYINVKNYTTKPVVFLRECRLPLGGLTQRTRQAIGYDMRNWNEIATRRVWLLHANTPLQHQCNVDQAQEIIGEAEPVYIEQNDEMIYSALWLIEK